MADRYAALFLPLTAVVAAVAWAVSGDPVRALTVFVVATPCPLILAAPIALLSGVSRAARIGVVVKGGGVIERLGNTRTVILDKTGTITLGTPELARIGCVDGLGEAEALRLAASVDLASVHPFATALVREAQDRGLALQFPLEVVERPGEGVEGTVAGRRVAVGSETFLRESRLHRNRGDRRERWHPAMPARSSASTGGWSPGSSSPTRRAKARSSSPRACAENGVVQVAMLTGDRRAVAERLGALLGIDRIYAEQTPEEKLAVVRAIKQTPGLAPVVMVGDGINDAPALALADVGIAMGSSAATASTETADAVILVDRVDRVDDAIRIGRRSLSIAKQSVLAGMGLSLAAMIVACFGYLTPVAGAIFQEGVDVAVILNALRALRG